MKTPILIAALFFSGYISAQKKLDSDSLKTNSIQEVMMTKKVFKKESDRFVYNIANSPVAKGNTTFEILKQTPLLSSTDDKTLTIAGKNNAVIYINGRKTNMDADSLAQFLKNTPAENIQKIEVITTPGSEYDVESSDGIVNIVLKKRTTDGLNGNIRMSNRHDKYNASNASFSINYRKDKLGIAANLNAGSNIEAQYYNLKNGNAIAFNETSGYVDDPNKNLGGYLNIDYQLNEKSNLALSWNSWANRSYGSKTDLFNVVTSSTGMAYSFSRNTENARSYNNSINLNYELKTDSLGSKLNVNAAYLNYKRFQLTENLTILSDANRNELGISRMVIQDMPQIINNFSGKVDYIKKFQNDFSMAIGGNFNHTKTDNDTKNDTYTLIPPEQMKSEPNHFVYQENIYAMYLTAEKKFSDKFSGKIGVRYEITNSLGTSDNSQNPDYRRIERNYSNILPYLSLNYNINDNNNISYAFSSRMRRPSFWEINPVKHILTEDNYIQNDPFVKASSIYNQNLTYMFKNAYFLSLEHTYKDDLITQVPMQRDIEKDGVVHKQLRYIRTNFGKRHELQVFAGMQKSFFNQYWSTNLQVGLQHNINNGRLSVDPTTGDVFPAFVNEATSTSFAIQMSNNIRLDKAKTWYLGINGFYVDRQLIELGLLRNLANVDVNIKKLWNNWTFALDFKDIFRTNIIEFDSTQPSGDYNYVRNDQYRRGVMFSISYNFGNQKIKKVRNIDSASDEIKNRTR